MLDTLLKIGEWQSRGKSKWDRFLDFPKQSNKKGSPTKNYTLSIIFDLDNQEVIIDSEHLKEYDESDVQEALSVKLKGSRNKKIVTAVPGFRLNYLYLAFFGKLGEVTETGELEEAIEKDSPHLLQDDLGLILRKIFLLKDAFSGKTKHTKKSGASEISIQQIEENFEFGKNESIVFVVCKVKSSELGLSIPTPFSGIDSYTQFLKQMYFPDTQEENDNDNKTNLKRLCYAEGELMDDVKGLNLTERFSLNKMFVTTTQNYAQEWRKDNFYKNYQVNEKNQEYLDYASDYLLNQGFTVRIANAEHVILPEFLSKTDVNLNLALQSIAKKTDLLFKQSLEKLDFFIKTIEDELKVEETFWINFLAFDKGGKKSFKVTESIKDVSSFHFQRVLNSFFEVDKQFEKDNFVDWASVMTVYSLDKKNTFKANLNFSTLYTIIPIKEKTADSFILRNKALDLFKTVLENRKVDGKQLYSYFCELILCHYYRRYKSYTNVREYGKDAFYFAVRDSVFKYLAFFQLLKKLKLINMDESAKSNVIINQYEQLETDFFIEMGFTKEQRAMFYLGRMLNSVEYMQKEKNKTVIQKVNFNGMNKDNIQRLRLGLIEKAKQYNDMNKVIFNDQKFSSEFDYNNWNLDPQEALFFLLTGYSFSAGKKLKNEIETENTNN